LQLIIDTFDKAVYMKSLTAAPQILLLSILMLGMVAPAFAQHEHKKADEQQEAPVTGPAMMNLMQEHMTMMDDPLRRSAMLVHMLPTMQESLGLSDDQVMRMKQSTQQYKERNDTHQQQMKRATEQLDELLASEDAPPNRVRSLLEETASHGARMQALAFESAAEMKGMLSAEQRAKLSGMKPMQMHHHMMTNMTMMEMMQAMHGGMVSGEKMGMMKQGMMNK